LTQVRRVQVRRYLLMYYTPETLLNHAFEDLRKPKAPNRSEAAHNMKKHGRDEGWISSEATRREASAQQQKTEPT
jgi:hypothetical protein